MELVVRTEILQSFSQPQNGSLGKILGQNDDVINFYKQISIFDFSASLAESMNRSWFLNLSTPHLDEIWTLSGTKFEKIFKVNSKKGKNWQKSDPVRYEIWKIFPSPP